jgi:hypothetical protein
MRASLFLIFAGLWLSACGGAQEPRGQEFCLSFESNYVGNCRAICESEKQDEGLGFEEAAKQCEPHCLRELADDSIYESDCPEGAAAAEKAAER